MTTDRSDDAPQGDRGDAAKSRSKIIKRYSNRKLYDTERSKYVTLDEIARMIKAGEEVTIIDNETKEDLTSVTLTQIIFEEEKRESRMPLGMLRNLIQTGGGALQDFFDKSVKAPVVEIKDTAQKGVEELKHGAQTLRDAATRSVSEWTDTALRVFTRDAEAKRAEEFKKAYSLAFDDLAKRIELRARDIVSSREHHASVAASGEAVPADASANGTAGASEPGIVRVQDEVDALRGRMKEIHALIDELERVGK